MGCIRACRKDSIVEREMHVASSTAAMPPCPIARASVAAQTRRDRSVNTGASAACFDRSMANCTHHRTMPDQAVQPILFSYLLTCP